MLTAIEIRDMDAAQIQERIQEETQELSNLRFQNAIARIDNPMLMRQKRRLIARLNTVLTEKTSA
jgi:large subunit ribosomal protein L29